MATRAAAALRHSAIVAAALSFLLPGLGQGWVGQFRRGLVLALPVCALAGFGIGILLSQGASRAVGLLLQPEVLIGLLVLDLVLLAYRVGAMVDAFQLARRRWPASGQGWQKVAASVVLGVLLTLTLGMHAGLGYLGLKTYDTVATVFGGPDPTPEPSPPPAAPSESAQPTPESTPSPTPTPEWPDDGWLNVLLIGGDAGVGRWSLRTDTMILARLELATSRVALFGIPRNLVNVPLPPESAGLDPCSCYPFLLNDLFSYASINPQWFPGDDDRGYRAVQAAIAEFTAVHIDGMVVVTLDGFVRLVDAIGGLDITTPYGLYDASYPHENGIWHEEIWIPAGQHHLDGHMALAFARSRNQDSDYDRMYRQQLTLMALRSQVNPCDLVFRIPELLDIARDSLWTNLPIRALPDLLASAAGVKVDRIVRHQLWPPQIPTTLDAASIALVRQMVANPFVVEGASPRPSASASPTPQPAPAC